MLDGVQNTRDVCQHFIVPEAHDLETLMLEEFGSLGVFDLQLCMLSTVELNNQPRIETNEIDDVGPDDLLPPEFSGRQSAIAQLPPEFVFCIGLSRAQMSG